MIKLGRYMYKDPDYSAPDIIIEEVNGDKVKWRWHDETKLREANTADTITSGYLYKEAE